MKDKGKYRTKSKEIWYETKQQRKERKSRYPLGFRQHNKRLVENLTWIILLLIFIIVLILLWKWTV